MRFRAFEIAAAVVIAISCLRGLAEPKRFARGKGVFDRWRVQLVARIDDVFPAPANAWIAGLLVGADQEFSKEWKTAFKRTGTTHLTAVSGYNVGIVLMGIQNFLLRLPFGRRSRLLLAALAIAGFVLLAGAPGSVLRAAVMIGAVEAGRLFGRPVKPLRALLIAAALIGIASPPSLIHDRGFQLSLLASFGLATIAPPLEALFPKPFPRVLAGWISQTVAASLATAPLIAWMAGTYSLVALPANVVVALFIPPITALGAALTATSFFSLSLAQTLALIGQAFFMAPLFAIRIFSAWPLASVDGPAAFIALGCVELAVLLIVIKRKPRFSAKPR